MPTNSYLLVAEVDKIQSFIFRSARRREVVGASYALDKFCQEVNEYLTVSVEKRLTSAGGSFRLVFASKLDAQQAAYDLEVAFNRQIAGSITIATPVEYYADNPGKSIEAGHEALRQAKLAGRPATAVWHLPVQAICTSCGLEIATHHMPLHPNEDPRYVCNTCLQKNRVPWVNLFGSLLEEVASLRHVAKIRMPPDPTEAETYANGWEPRNYVAYMLADGNRMGELFSYCRTVEAHTMLSDAVSRITREALADAIHLLIDQHPVWSERHLLPCLPLIMGGDDLFVLLPAAWAYDVASRFCAVYEIKMQQVINDLHADGSLDNPEVNEPPSATIGAAVVICKATYPYKLAHQHGDRLLENVKDVGKDLNASLLAVDQITGSDVIESVVRREPLMWKPAEVDRLLNWRVNLNGLPSRTREDLRHQWNRDEAAAWLLTRLQKRSEQTYYLVQSASEDLGQKGLLELFNCWDFAYDARNNRAIYMRVGEMV